MAEVELFAILLSFIFPIGLEKAEHNQQAGVLRLEAICNCTRFPNTYGDKIEDGGNENTALPKSKR